MDDREGSGKGKQQRHMKVGKHSPSRNSQQWTPHGIHTPSWARSSGMGAGRAGRCGHSDVPKELQMPPRNSSCLQGQPPWASSPGTSAGPPWGFPPSLRHLCFPALLCSLFSFSFPFTEEPLVLMALPKRSVRASTAPFDKSQEFFPTEEGGKPTAHLLSDPSPAALRIQLSCDSEDKKRAFSPQCSQWTELCTYRG